MVVMSAISKPCLVDLLRIADRNHWFSPRIRYASVRSKPELLKDLGMYFHFRKRKGKIEFVPKRNLVLVPSIEYSFGKSCFLFDGEPIDVCLKAREKPVFRYIEGPVTVEF